MNINTERTVSIDQGKCFHAEQKEEWQRSPPQRSRCIVPLCRVDVSRSDSSPCDKTRNHDVKGYNNSTTKVVTDEHRRQNIPSRRRCQDFPLCPLIMDWNDSNHINHLPLSPRRPVNETKTDAPPRYPKRRTYPTDDYRSTTIIDPPQQQQQQQKRNHSPPTRWHSSTKCLIGWEISFLRRSSTTNQFS
jgi:hypothetical protein